MNKTEAATFLNCSVRAVERYVATGKLAAVKVRGKTGQVLSFDADELERFKAEINTPERVTATKPDNRDNTALAQLDGASTSVSTGDNVALVRALHTLAQLAPASIDKARQVPTENKLLLTLAEAQALTGLSRNVLRGAIDDGSLKAKQIGRGWKVKRSDLENYVEKL